MSTLPQTLPQLLYAIEETTTLFKENVLSALQLYFDGLVENKIPASENNPWPEQERALDALLKATGMTLLDNYRNYIWIRFAEVRKMILPHASILIRYGSEKNAKSRQFREMDKYISRYGDDISQILRGRDIDVIIPLASGGFEPACLHAEDWNVDKIIPLRYSRYGKDDPGVLFPRHMPDRYLQKHIQGKTVLICEDFIASGETLSTTIRFIRNYHPARIYASTVRWFVDAAQIEECRQIPTSGFSRLYSDGYQESAGKPVPAINLTEG